MSSSLFQNKGCNPTLPCPESKYSQTYIQLQNAPVPANSLLSSSLMGLKQQLIYLLILFIVSQGKYPKFPPSSLSSAFNIPLLLQSQLSQYVNFTFGRYNTSVIPIVFIISSAILGNTETNASIGQDLLKFLCTCTKF